MLHEIPCKLYEVIRVCFYRTLGYRQHMWGSFKRFCNIYYGFYVKHNENLPMQYTEFFSAVKNENFIRKMWIFFLFLHSEKKKSVEQIESYT